MRPYVQQCEAKSSNATTTKVCCAASCPAFLYVACHISTSQVPGLGSCVVEQQQGAALVHRYLSRRALSCAVPCPFNLCGERRAPLRYSSPVKRCNSQAPICLTDDFANAKFERRAILVQLRWACERPHLIIKRRPPCGVPLPRPRALPSAHDVQVKQQKNNRRGMTQLVMRGRGSKLRDM